MPFYKTDRQALDRANPVEMVLELNSFSGGENTIGEDHALKANEARIIKNWDAISVGGMIRSKGFGTFATAGTSVVDKPLDLLKEHIETTVSRIYAITDGDLLYRSSGAWVVADSAGFTSGALSHAVSKGDKLWITNSTDNLQYKTNAGSLTTPADVPTSARDRIYYFKSRLLAEGGGKDVYGCRAGVGNWTAGDAWSLTNDAWSISMPDYTQGCLVGFPNADDVCVFTKYGAYSIFNIPNVGSREIVGAHGCSCPYSLAVGTEGAFLVSENPTLGVWLWNGVNWTDLTINEDFVNDIDFSYRVFGAYRGGKYYLTYCETGSGETVPNVTRIYDAQYGRWMQRPVNADLADNFGIIEVAPYADAIYAGSSKHYTAYELETTDTDDDGNDTQALYRTKYFSSRDFNVSTGGEFTIDDVRMKLIKFTAVYYGSVGSFSLQWTADYGKRSGSQTINLTSEGDKLNTTFTVNTSYLSELPPDTSKTYSLANNAIGRRFRFDILNDGDGDRPKIKRIKIHAVALEEV